MIKNKMDFRLVNIALVVLTIFLLYQTGYLWMGVTDKIIAIITPFFIGFIVAYALYPACKWLQDHHIPKGLSIFLVIALVIAIFAIILVLVVPLLVDQLSNLFNNIIAFLKELSIGHDLNIGSLQRSLSDSFNDIIKDLGKYVSDGAINIIGVSLGVISTAVISFSASIYLLSDMERIRSSFKQYLIRKSKRAYRYFSILDQEMKSYLTGFLKIVVITLFEYTLTFYFIGHPNALLLGCLAAVANLIPYFGGIITNCIACITAFVTSPWLFFKTLIAFFVLSSIDGYVVNPLVYGKTNEVHPIFVIFSVFAGGILLGVPGIILSLPVAILIQATIKFFKPEIKDKLDDMKEMSLLEKEEDV